MAPSGSSNNRPREDNDLLWVHYDAVNLTSFPSKHQVYSHLQTSSRAQKRRAEGKVLRASVLKGRTSALKDPSLQRIAKRNVEDGQPPISGRAAQPPKPADQRSSYVPREAHNQITRATSPVSMVGKGNSDPFQTFSIPIGPEENQLILLYRDYVLPSVYHLQVKNKGLNDKNMQELAERDWRDNIAGLEDEGTALATLARYGSIVSRSNPDLRSTALKYLGQSTRVLRQKVSQRGDLSSISNCLHINMLFNAEIINLNLVGAVTHGKAFLHIFKQQWDEQRLDYKMLLYQLHNDMQLTSTFLIRPIFDHGEWLPKVLKPLWDAAAPYMLEVEIEDNLDPAIDHPVLLYWFKRRRQQLYHEGAKASDKDAIPPLPLVTGSFMATTFLFHSRMLHHYLDTEKELKDEGLSLETKSSLYVRQLLALASTQLHKWAGYSPRILGVQMYDNKRYLNALRAAIEQCEACAAKAAVNKYSNAITWALYLGALAERDTLSESRQISNRWFHRKLASFARSAQVTTWDDLKAILKGFLYQESQLSKGSVWFEELVVNSRPRESP